MIPLSARVPILIALFTSSAGLPAGADEWKRHTIDTSSRGADGVRLADVNNDGRLDVVTPWEEGGDVRVAYDQGVGQSPRWVTQSVGKEPSVEDAVAVDLDRDGHLEVVASAEGKARVMRVFSQRTKLGEWSGHELGSTRGRQQFMFAMPYDTQSGNRVLVVGGKNQRATVSVWSPGDNPSNFETWNERVIRKAGWMMSLQAVDMDGDGIDDILLTDRKGKLRGAHWIRCDKNGPTKHVVPVGGHDAEVMFLTYDDFDGDGDVDVAVAARPQLLLLYERLSDDGTRWKERRMALPAKAGLGKGVAIETSFGQTEIFVSSGAVKEKDRLSIVRFVWKDPSTVMTAEPDFIDVPGGTTGIKFDRMELIDLDGDGDRDLLTCEERENLGVVWYERP